MVTTSGDELSARIQSLAQELQDHILDYTLVFDAGIEVTIDKDYKPPWQLSVNRRTRNIVATSYYRNSTFLVSSHSIDYTEILLSWLRSLASKHRNLIENITTICPYGGRFNSTIAHAKFIILTISAQWLRRVADFLEGDSQSLRDGILRARCIITKPSWDRWVMEGDEKRLQALADEMGY